MRNYEKTVYKLRTKRGKKRIKAGNKWHANFVPYSTSVNTFVLAFRLTCWINMSLKRSEFGCRIVFRCSFLPDNCSRIEREREKKNWFRVRKESGSAKKDVGWMAGRIRRNSVLLGNQLYRPCMRVIGRIWTLIRTIGEGRGRDAFVY